MADKELMELIARKPERGLELLIKRYSGLVFSVVRGRLAGLCPAEDIEECVSDTFISFYRSMAGFDPEKGSIKGYLCTIAKRRAAELYARKKREAPTVSIDDEAAAELTADEFSIDEAVIEGEARHRIFEAVNALPEPDREILIRKYYLREPSKSIAERLGMSASAVDTRACRALKKLKSELGGLIK